jgi:tRNA uridine 5-carboxymethylaminomethyl modification enzyme
LRLTETGRRLGVVDDVRWDAFNRKRDAIVREQERLKSTWVTPKSLPAEVAERVLGKPIEREYSLMDLLKRPGVSYASLAELSERDAFVGDEAVASQVEIQTKYQGYVERQHEEILRQERYEAMALPRDLDYRSVRGLSIEVQQRLNQHKPETIGQASRMSGITPAAISLLLVHLKRAVGTTERSAA